MLASFGSSMMTCLSRGPMSLGEVDDIFGTREDLKYTFRWRALNRGPNWNTVSARYLPLKGAMNEDLTDMEY